ncbi:MAG: 16S rRNA (guanine(966)-N(2))-methyltransferase RsmD [Deltaproteobacteria bacterium]|nr:16S rRNA (guanine(966)-N(2))-methyltransferase RsmD [Deltaproteobacteria bacterium]
MHDISIVRIIAGIARGRHLIAPKGMDTRPTPDRVRESLFSILAMQIEGAHVLDLFAGTGALGLEALSRGAQKVTLVEHSRKVYPVLKRNIATVALPGVELFIMDALRALTHFASLQFSFNLVFLDPPFAQNLIEASLIELVKQNLLLPNALIVCEHLGKRLPPYAPDVLKYKETREFGDVALSFFEA